jgi:hypothetical protein
MDEVAGLVEQMQQSELGRRWRSVQDHLSQARELREEIEHSVREAALALGQRCIHYAVKVTASTLLIYDESRAIEEVTSRRWYDCLTLDTPAFEKRVRRLLADKQQMPGLEALSEEERCSIIDKLTLESVSTREVLAAQIADNVDMRRQPTAVDDPEHGDELARLVESHQGHRP